jgi:radical SAM protein with 4Fe4S-binding SPASM domain
MLDRYIALAIENPIIHFWPQMGFLRYHDKFNLPPNTIAFNRSGIEILSRCDGTRRVCDIATELAELYKTNYEEVVGQITRFLKSIESTIPLKFSDHPIPIKLRITGSTDYIIPIHVAIELTYTCNLRCRHCYVPSSPERTEQMPLDRIISLFDLLDEWGVSVIELTGGEPLMHPHFEKILQVALEHFDLIGVITNGTLINDSILDIMSSDPTRVVVQIDLDGITSEYVDWFRGRVGTYERELEAIRRIVQRGIMLRVAMIVTPGNLDQIVQTAALVRRLGATAFGISPVVPQGRGTDPSLLLSPQEYEKFIDIWNKLRHHYKDFIFQSRETPFQLARGNCGAGSRTVTITPSGDVKICQMSDTAILCYGNVFTQNGKELFDSELVRYIAQLEPPNLDTCSDCQYLGFCINCLNRGIIKGKELGPDNCIWYKLHWVYLEKAK